MIYSLHLVTGNGSFQLKIYSFVPLPKKNLKRSLVSLVKGALIALHFLF